MPDELVELKKRVYESLKDDAARVGMERAERSFEESRARIEDDPYLEELAREVKKLKEESLRRLDDLVREAIESMERNGINVVMAGGKEEALEAIGRIVGSGKLVVKSKSIVSEELELRSYLESLGNTVWETDLGEFLLQISGGSPSHFVAVSMHLSREKIREVLEKKIGYRGSGDVVEMVAAVRSFLRSKILSADVGITGANAVAAREGALVQVENESNVRLTSSLPPVYVAVTSIEKVVPNLVGALKVALLEAYMIGGTPPTFVNIVSGPSGTRDVEHMLVRPAQGAREMHVVLVDNGRSAAAKNRMAEVLKCIKCGACQAACPVLTTVGPAWSSGAYMGGIGVLWTAITKGFDEAKRMSYLCGGCGVCEQYCPLSINISGLVWEIKRAAMEA